MAQTHVPNSRWRQARALIARRRFAALASVAGLAVVAVIALAAIGVATFGSSRGGDDSGVYDGSVAPAVGLAVRAPEEGLSSAAPAHDDAKGTASSGGVTQSATDGAGGSGVPLPSQNAGRTIIRSAGMELEVAVVADAFEQVRQIAVALGGYVGDSTFNGAGEHQTAHLTVRVPADRFGDAITQIRGLAAEVQSISTSAHDVTEEYRDVEATIRNLRAVEQRYIELLGRAGSIGDILQVQDRLNQVRLEIDRTEARRQLLASQSELATITVSLRPVGADGAVIDGPRGPLDAAADAWRSSLNTLSALATAVLVVAVYSWWIVPPAVVLIVLARRRWMRRASDVTVARSD
ncbi:MAG: DUF4349 domain-containing protein [Chloroflexi bacterium]|nr:DUF4349 domain-containing protein [Chloroflexota bacterium]MDA1003355.1 DUF4349 domain-containing protein [Chloroflexota bacterium]MQC27788.1 DUF4349 domain-containing protein [Chloroflexota bacterium]